VRMSRARKAIPQAIFSQDILARRSEKTFEYETDVLTSLILTSLILRRRSHKNMACEKVLQIFSCENMACENVSLVRTSCENMACENVSFS